MNNSLRIALIFCVFAALFALASVVTQPQTPEHSVYLVGGVKG